MGLQEGSLQALIGNTIIERDIEAADTLFRQMLQALDFLAHKKILHRDIKPDNILYTLLPTGKYHFRITDFGMSNLAINAVTYAGSPLFMAPEILQNSGCRQTSKVDVWSLFVTMAYALNANGYRQKQPRHLTEAVEMALAAAKAPLLDPIKDMAIVDPVKRASAAEMLIKLYQEDGLSTPRENISPLNSFSFSCVPISGVGKLAAPQNLKTRNKPKLSRTHAAENRIQKRLVPSAVQQGRQRHCKQTTLDGYNMPGRYSANRRY